MFSNDVWSVPTRVGGREGMVEGCLWYWDSDDSDRITVESAEKEIVIFLHSGALSADGWDFQVAPLVAASYRVVLYARAGYAPSSHTRDQIAQRTAVADLRQVVHTLQLKRVHLVGAGKGGWFAIDYALSNPEAVLSLAIVSSHLNIQEPDWFDRCNRLKPPFFASLPDDFKELSPSYRAGCAKGHDEWVRRNKAARSFPGAPDQSALENTINWSSLESIKLPTLLVTGDADLYVPPSLLRLQHSHLKNSELFIVPEAGHNPYWENPEVFNERLLAFLKSNTQHQTQ